MEITDKEKAEIKRYYRGQYKLRFKKDGTVGQYKLRFKKDGTVEAQKTSGGSWGILYTPWYTEQHLKYIREGKNVQS